MIIENFDQFILERFYQPSKETTNKIKKLVEKLEKKWIGGRAFFDALDYNIKHVIDQEVMLGLVKGNKNEWLASSGEFGDILYKLYQQGKFKCKGLVVFNGKMNANNLNAEYYYPKDIDIENKKFIYIDDSYFSGKTVNKINDYLKKYGSKIKSTSVVYDGSKIKKPNVNSFYRYYETS